MPTLVLRDSGGADVGFMLVAGDDPIETGSPQRDVVLMKLPLPSQSPLAIFIGDHRHTEFKAEITKTSAGTSFSIAVTPSSTIRGTLETSGEGSWSAGSIGSGSCKVLPAKR